MASFEVITYGRFWVIAEGVDLQSTLKLPEYPKQISPCPIRRTHLDAEALLRVVKPFADLSNSRKEKWKAEGDRPLVEALFARMKAKPPIRSDTNIDVNGEVLVGSKVVHDAAAVFAIDHVGVKTSAFSSC